MRVGKPRSFAIGSVDIALIVSIPTATRAGGRRYWASLEVIEAIGHWVTGGRIAFVRRRSSFSRRHPGDFNVAMWQLCRCPSGFPRICNVAEKGAPPH